MAKKKKKIRKTNLSLSLLTVVFVGVALGLTIYRLAIKSVDTTPQIIKIGFIDQSGQLGAQLAIKDINSEGGLKIGSKSYPVKLETEDPKDSIDIVESEVKDLADNNKVLAIIGPSTDKLAIPASDVSNSQELVLISPGSTDPALTVDAKTTDLKRYIFRVSYTNTQEATSLAKFAQETLKSKNAAVLFDKESQIFSTEATAFQKAFESLGGKVTNMESFGERDYDYTKQFSDILNSQIDSLLIFGNPDQSVNLIQRANYLGIKTQILGTDSWDNNSFLTKCDKYCEGVYISARFSPDLSSDETKSFVEEFRSTYNSDPTELDALTYDSLGILFQGLIKAGSFNEQALRDGISQISDYLGTTGTIKFNGTTGDSDRTVTILQVKNGKFNYSTSLNP